MAKTNTGFVVNEIISPLGIKAWLVVAKDDPLITVKFGFRGGDAYDPEDKLGLATVAAVVSTEAAGAYDFQTFQRKLEERGISIGLNAGVDFVIGGLQALAIDKDAAIDALTLAVNSPRFDQEDIDRTVKSLVSSILSRREQPQSVVGDLVKKLAFASHRYGRTIDDSLDDIKKLTTADLIDWHKKVFGRDSLRITIVGDLTDGQAGQLIDKVFGKLPEHSTIGTIANVSPASAVKDFRQMKVPQTAVGFFFPGIGLDDPDYFAIRVVNNILGGTPAFSRLFKEIRDKRGLSYGIYVSLDIYQHASLVVGGFSTRTDKVDESIAVLKEQIALIANKGASAKEVEESKNYLIGGYAIQFTSSSAIASILLRNQLDGLPANYLELRSNGLSAVTVDDAKRVAERVYGQPISLAVVGKRDIGAPPGENAPKQPEDGKAAD